jgi:hypothetical protein
MRPLTTALLALALHGTLAHAEEVVTGIWVPVTGRSIPANANPVSVGVLPDGQTVSVCRGRTAQLGVAVGRFVPGSNVCLVVDGKRPVALSDYDVLVAPPSQGLATTAAVDTHARKVASGRELRARDLATASAVDAQALKVAPGSERRAHMLGQQASHFVGGVSTAVPADCSPASSGHHSDAAQSSAPKYGSVDNQSGAYIEEHFSDGYVLYQFSGGTVVQTPTGSRAFCPMMAIRSDVQSGSPPALPGDPTLGARWVAHHNGQLLDIIRQQVGNDQATFAAIEADEQATTGGDLFRQTDYLTGVAAFYATHGR